MSILHDLQQTRRLSGAGAFAAFGVLAILGFMFIRKFTPETKGCQLEEVQQFRENGGERPEAGASESSSRKTTDRAETL